MLVCQCNGVTDRAIRRAVRQGAQTSLDVGDACGAGSGCGGCVPLVEKIIRHEASRHEKTASAPLSTAANLQQ